MEIPVTKKKKNVTGRKFLSSKGNTCQRKDVPEKFMLKEEYLCYRKDYSVREKRNSRYRKSIPCIRRKFLVYF